jgi:hypothetical protein
MADLGKMSKKQLETYARKELGVELDRRHNKKQLLWEVQELLEDRPLVEEVEEVEVLTPPVTPKAFTSSIDVRKHIEKISSTRKDAATVWSVITDGHTDDDIRVIVKSLKFETLLGEIS